MSISITINNINTLSDTERAVLRLIAGEMVTATVADTLKAAVRGIAGCGHTCDEPGRLACDNCGDKLAAQLSDRAPVEPTEAHSPHTQVIDLPQAPAPSGAAELDANGLPWDKRIHSSSRAKVADGTWRYARNLDKVLIATVEAELRAVQSIPSPAASTVHATGHVDFAPETRIPAPTGWPFGAGTHGSPELDADAAKLEATAGAGQTVADVTAPIVPLPPTVPLAPSALPMTLVQLMQHVTPLLVSGKLTQPILQGVVDKCGLPHLTALGARPDLVETVRTAIDEVVGGVQ